MYTQCPECLTVYQLQAELLVPACGCVRCGHCQAVFNALGTLAAQLPPEPFTRLDEHALDREPPLADVAVFRPRPAPVEDFVALRDEDEDTSEGGDEEVHGETDHGTRDDSDERAAHGAAGPATHDPHASDDVPGGDFSQLTFTPKFAAPKRRSWHTVAWVLVCVALVLGLGAQLAWAKRESLIADPTVGPFLTAGCELAGCHLPLVAQPQRLRLLAREVEQHPSVRDGLLITASVRNDALFAQPYPVVTIVLSDVDGKRLAMRRFQPADYVGDAAMRRHGLAGGATTAMVFEVQDPGQRAVAFAFTFE